MQPSKEVIVSIRSLAFGGDGVGEVVQGPSELLGISAFVPYAAVGEKVLAKVIEHKQRYLKAELIEVLLASEKRVEPQCKYFRSCGGCEIQHLSYPEQLKVKYDMLCGAMRAARISITAIEKVANIIESEPFHYRRRISLHVNPDGRVGFYRPNSRSLVPVESCEIATVGINYALKDVIEFSRVIAGKISSVVLEQDASGVIVVLKSPYDLSVIEIENILAEAKRYFTDCILFVGEKEVGGFGRQILELPISPSVSLSVPAGSFSQVNWEINQKLVQFALDKIKNTSRVCDLYAGAGNFSIPMARHGAEVVAVECEKRLVQLGRTSAKRLAVEKRLQFQEQSVESFLRTKPKNFDLILADPPRSGLGVLCNELNFADKLVLISCSLPSFVRDLKSLLEKGWSVEEIVPFDMFAQSSYLEIAAYLRK